jgi:hypothetical protein
MVRAQSAVPRDQERVFALRGERNAAIGALRRDGSSFEDIVAAVPLTTYDLADLARVWDRAEPDGDRGPVLEAGPGR